ncbi:MAG: lipopolysaccharide heptosyltransferase II [Candidatus Krumholzibacteriia bacterium]
MKPRERSILLVASNWLGDAVMSLPLLGYLAGMRDARVTVLAQGYTARVFWGLGQVGELVVMSKDGFTRRLWRRSRALRALAFDGALLLPPSFSSALSVFLGGVPNRVGFAGDGRGVLLNEALAGGGLRDEHLSENYLRLGRALAERLRLGGAGEFAVPSIEVFANERDSARNTLASCGAPPGDYAVVVPGETYGETKSWPVEKYRALAGRLSGEMPVVLGGARGERGLCEAVADGLKGVYNLAGLTGLGDFFALLAGARVLVANDSGAPHAAASIGTPVVVIFGSTSPVWTRPLGETVLVIREPVPCSPCFRKSCPTQLECYQGISMDTVFDAALSAAGGAGEVPRASATHNEAG